MPCRGVFRGAGVLVASASTGYMDGAEQIARVKLENFFTMAQVWHSLDG